VNWILGAVVYAVFVALALWIQSRETYRLQYAPTWWAVGMLGFILAAVTVVVTR
jgi:FtsH-binding integral membrane protein